MVWYFSACFVFWLDSGRLALFFKQPLILLFILPVLMWAVVEIIKCFRSKKEADQRVFYLVKDTVVRLEERKITHRSKKDYYLHFNLYGEKQLCNKSYKWSKLYGPLSAKGNYFFAHPGDEYYLLFIPEEQETIYQIYHTELFELAEEDFESAGERYLPQK